MNLPKAEYFDGLAEEWDTQNPHDLRKLEYIIGLLGLRAGQAVLDVGSGTGVMIPYLLKSLGPCGWVAAVDYSPRMIAVAKLKYPQDKYPNLRFDVRDINDLTLHGQYDAIVCYSCFPHFENQKATVMHLTAGLADRGRLIIAHSESREAINMLHRGSSEDVHRDLLPPISDLRQMMQTAGLKVVREMDTSSIFLIIAEES